MYSNCSSRVVIAANVKRIHRYSSHWQSMTRIEKPMIILLNEFNSDIYDILTIE